jgi:hypothetical protein
MISENVRQFVASAVKRRSKRLLFKPSKAYRQGLRTRLLLRIRGYAKPNPYKCGTARFESFRAGLADGWTIDIRAFCPIKTQFSSPRSTWKRCDEIV